MWIACPMNTLSWELIECQILWIHSIAVVKLKPFEHHFILALRFFIYLSKLILKSYENVSKKAVKWRLSNSVSPGY